MKKIALLALSAVFMTSLSLSAQEPTANNNDGKNTENRMPPPPPGQRMKQLSASERAQRMAAKLALTDAQKEKVQALFEEENTKREQFMAERQNKMKAHREQVNARRDEMKKQIEARRAEHDKALVAIIGQEKLDEWRAVQKERSEKLRGRRSMMKNKRGSGNKMPPPPPVVQDNE